MKAVIQRVSNASVSVDGEICGKIDAGLMILLGIGRDDDESKAQKLADKIAAMRIFEDETEKLNLSVSDIKGSVLVVSQFTLYADCRKGNRPSFTAAGRPETAEPLYEYFSELLRKKGLHVENGIFGAHMQVSLCNDGPVTIILEY